MVRFDGKVYLLWNGLVVWWFDGWVIGGLVVGGLVVGYYTKIHKECTKLRKGDLTGW